VLHSLRRRWRTAGAGAEAAVPYGPDELLDAALPETIGSP
jgi:hypothetical protein